MIERVDLTSTMAGTAKSLFEALLSASQYITARPHCATNQDRLPCELIIDRDEWMVGREGAG